MTTVHSDRVVEFNGQPWIHEDSLPSEGETGMIVRVMVNGRREVYYELVGPVEGLDPEGTWTKGWLIERVTVTEPPDTFPEEWVAGT